MDILLYREQSSVFSDVLKTPAWEAIGHGGFAKGGFDCPFTCHVNYITRTAFTCS